MYRILMTTVGLLRPSCEPGTCTLLAPHPCPSPPHPAHGNPRPIPLQNCNSPYKIQEPTPQATMQPSLAPDPVKPVDPVQQRNGRFVDLALAGAEQMKGITLLVLLVNPDNWGT